MRRVEKGQKSTWRELFRNLENSVLRKVTYSGIHSLLLEYILLGYSFSRLWSNFIPYVVSYSVQSSVIYIFLVLQYMTGASIQVFESQY